MHLSGHNGAIQFLKTSVDPRNFTTAPPNMFNQSTFPKSVSISGNWTVRDSVGNPGPVKDTSGIILWETQRGVASIKHVGIVPVNTVANAGFQITGDTMFMTPRLTFTQEFALPYQSGTARDVQVSPDLGEDFSTVRSYAGMLSVLSDSVPIGNTALTGRLSGGSINDIRDIMQSPTGSFTESGLQQQTITNKDGIKNVGISEGIVTVLGPDLVPTFGPPDPATTLGNGISDRSSTIVTPSANTAIQAGQTVAGTITPNIGYLPINPIFVTPVAGLVCSQVNAFDVYNSIDTVKIGDLPISAEIQLAVAFPGFVLNVAASNEARSVAVEYYSQPLYGYVDAAGNIILDSDEGTYSWVNPVGGATVNNFKQTGYQGSLFQMSGIAAITNLLVEPLLVEFPKPSFRAPQGGTYLGSLVWMTLTFIGTQTTGAMTFTRMGGAGGQVNIHATALDLYNSGRLGPCRVLRWDNVGVGQEVKLDGVIVAQCVPEGQIAPFVSPSAQLQQAIMHLNVYPWLNQLYNSTGPFKRIWSGRDYSHMVEKLRDTAIDDTLLMSRNDEGAGQAAGLFSTLGSTVGHGLGSMVDEGLNTGIASLGSMFAAGQYGSAAGMYGGAAGMYGDAAGMYGNSSKRLREF